MESNEDAEDDDAGQRPRRGGSSLVKTAAEEVDDGAEVK
jgi:hypothetical protein